MLVFSRRVGETLLIDGNIRVQVLEVSGMQTQFGVTAQHDIPVRREEVDPRARSRPPASPSLKPSRSD
ncbi:carbon storage regulator [Lysobacter sp. GCM10012299]|uniref:carbon storage regulator n=1 Tax=Lysobacter sp. GCM10012299 TaxID=3317333 RepID=UPI0036164193